MILVTAAQGSSNVQRERCLDIEKTQTKKYEMQTEGKPYKKRRGAAKRHNYGLMDVQVDRRVGRLMLACFNSKTSIVIYDVSTDPLRSSCNHRRGQTGEYCVVRIIMQFISTASSSTSASVLQIHKVHQILHLYRISSSWQRRTNTEQKCCMYIWSHSMLEKPCQEVV